MARQEGLVKLKGKIGDLSFYKTQDGHFARMKGGVDGDRIQNNPAFERTRENGVEFGRAGKADDFIRLCTGSGDVLRLLLVHGSFIGVRKFTHTIKNGRLLMPYLDLN